MNPMVLAAGISTGGGILSSILGGRAQKDAAEQQMALQKKMWRQTKKQTRPYRQAGQNALSAYNFELGLGDQPEGYGGFDGLPSTQFEMDQARRAAEASAAARGGLGSGRTLMDVANRTQNIARTHYGTHLNRLAGMTDMGLGATGMSAGNNAAYGAGGSNALANYGNAGAAQWAGVNNAIQGGLQTGIGLWGYQNALQQQGGIQPSRSAMGSIW